MLKNISIEDKRRQAKIEWAEKDVVHFDYCLEIARQQLASLESREKREAFLEAQKSRRDPGGPGYLYDLRTDDPTVERAKEIVKLAEKDAGGARDMVIQTIAGWRYTKYQADIIIAFKETPHGYPEIDNPYYWNDKRQPKLEKLKERLNMYISEFERNGLWPGEYQASMKEKS